MKITHAIILSILTSLLTASIILNVIQLAAAKDGMAAQSNAAENPAYVDMDSKAQESADAGVGKKSRVFSQKRPPRFEDDYRAFFAKYPMSEEKKDLIGLALVKEMEATVNSVLQRKPGENIDLKARRENVNAQRRQFEESLRKPLGDEAFEALVYYRDTMLQRMLADTIADQMNASGCALSTETHDKLVRIFKDNNVTYAPEQTRLRSPTIAKSTASRLAAKEGVVMREAANVLSQQQMEVLKQVWGKLTSSAREEKPSGKKE